VDAICGYNAEPFVCSAPNPRFFEHILAVRNMSSEIPIRPADSDDVKWALHTATTQLERGSLADAIQWIKRAAQYAEESGDAWRATELKNSARELAERMWTSDPEPEPGQSLPPLSLPIEVSVEDVEADELLEEATVQPPRGAFQSVPPGVVLRQSHPAQGYPTAGHPSQNYPSPGYPAQGYPAQGYPAQGYPAQGYPAQGHSTQGAYPGQGYPARGQSDAGYGDQFLESHPPSNYPLESAPPEPIPLYPTGALQPRPHPLNAVPGAWQPPPPAPTGFSPAPSSPQGGVAPPFAQPAPITHAQPAAFSPNHGSNVPFVTQAPTLQFGSPEVANQTAPAPGARRSIRPKVPQAIADSTRPPPPHRSNSLGTGSAGGPDVFSSAPPTERFTGVLEGRSPLEPPRGPLGSAPELLIEELDLDNPPLAASSLLPPPPSSEPELTPEEFEPRATSSDPNVVSSASLEEIDPSLAELFVAEEVVEDDDSLDRMSDLVLDPTEFEDQSLLDDQEETHVLSRQEMRALTGATQSQGSSHSSGQHATTSSSDVPTAPPPTSTSSLVSNAPPPFSRSVSPDMRRALPLSSQPPTPFKPAPSAPHASDPASAPLTPLSSAPPTPRATSSLPPGRSTPPLLVRRSSGPKSGRPTSEGASLRLSASGSVRPDDAPTSTPPSSVAPTSIPPSSVAPTSVAPSVAPAPVTAAPSTSPGVAPPSVLPPVTSTPPAPSRPSPEVEPLQEPIVDGVDLTETRGFEDLPEEVQLSLARVARVEELQAGEEVSFFGAAIVTSGRVDILPAFSEETGAVADEGDVIFTHGNLDSSIDLRVVAKMDATRVAVWDPETLRNAIAECPWVADELKLIADRYLALCGATLGPLGDRLDDALRATVFQRLEVQVFGEGDVLVEAGSPIPGLLIVGGGRLLLGDHTGEQAGELTMGDFVFPAELIGGRKAPQRVIAARGGALVLTTSRQIAHELMMSVPPLVEVLAG
jgi:hypothetical protein